MVIDANIFASALIQPKGPSGSILRSFAEKGTFQLVSSQSILDETERCLFYPRVRKRITITDEEIKQWLAAIALLADVVADTLKLDVVKDDPDDNKILAAAVEGKATHVVTGDPDLLDLKQYEGIQILRPAHFIRLIQPDWAPQP